jgi:hypothetical protein
MAIKWRSVDKVKKGRDKKIWNHNLWVIIVKRVAVTNSAWQRIPRNSFSWWLSMRVLRTGLDHWWVPVSSYNIRNSSSIEETRMWTSVWYICGRASAVTFRVHLIWCTSYWMEDSLTIHQPILPSLRGARETPHKSLIVHLKIEFHIQVWPEFLQTRKDSQTFELISGKLPLLLGQSLGGISYGLLIAVKVL